MKIATIVELDVKEIRSALFATAKAQAKAEAGSSSIHFVIEDGELKRAIVRFGNRLTEEKDEPESIQEKDEAQAADDQEKLQSPFRED